MYENFLHKFIFPGVNNTPVKINNRSYNNNNRTNSKSGKVRKSTKTTSPFYVGQNNIKRALGL